MPGRPVSDRWRLLLLPRLRMCRPKAGSFSSGVVGLRWAAFRGVDLRVSRKSTWLSAPDCVGFRSSCGILPDPGPVLVPNFARADESIFSASSFSFDFGDVCCGCVAFADDLKTLNESSLLFLRAFMLAVMACDDCVTLR